MRGLGILLVSILVVSAAWISPRTGWGQAREARDLLRTEPFDRLTLNDGTVLEVEPISPRPLPAYDDRLAKRVAEAEKTIPREGNVLLPDQTKALEEAKKRQDEAQLAREQVSELTIKPVGDPNVYKVKRTNIRSVEYFEDMLLSAADRLIERRDFARAFEHLLLVRNRVGDWNGLQDRVDRLLYEEGSAALADNDIERGLRLLHELFDRRPDYPGLLDKLAKSYGGRITRAFRRGAYADGRSILKELSEFAPDHPATRDARKLFVDRARSHMETAEASSDPAVKLDALTEAVRVWPALDGADAAYREAFAAFPTLDVSVTDVPRPMGPWIRSPADSRVSPLVYLPILAAGDEDALRGRRTDQLAGGVDVLDLGRRLEITLRDGPVWADGSGPVSAIDLVRSFSDRALAGSPRYSARWEALLGRVEVLDSRRVSVSLRRTSLIPDAWLRGPIGPAHAGSDGRVAGSEGTRSLVGDGTYTLALSSGDRTEFRARLDATVNIRRLREYRVPVGEDAVRGLKRGEVSLAEHIPARLVRELETEQEIRVGRYALPRLHVLALDGRTHPLTNRSLRRAISYAIDRKTILEESLLGRTMDEDNQPMRGAFAVDSYAHASDLAPLEHQPTLARLLVAAARKELDSGPIRLQLEYPAHPEARLAAPRIAAALRAAGLLIDLVEQPQSVLESELRSGRRFDLAYRVVETPEPVMDAGPLLCPAYDAPSSTDALSSQASPRIRQLLLELEQAPEFPTARELVIQIDREVPSELPIIPLWQMRDHYAWRTRLKGPPEETADLYRHIETWEIDPWFARDP